MDGLAGGFTAIVLPYIAVQKGMSVTAIGAIIGAYVLAAPVKLLWSPILDMWWTLKRWYLLGTAITIITILTMFQAPIDDGGQWLLIGLGFVLGTASQIANAAQGALLVLTVERKELSAASGYVQGSKLVMQGVSGGAGVLIATRWGMSAASLCFAGAVVFTSLPIGMISEPARRLVSLKLSARLLAVGGEMVDMARQPRSRWVMLAFLTPIGAGGASYLWPALAPEWHAGPNVVSLANGLGAAAASGLGCFIYGRFVGHFDRIKAFLTTAMLLVGAALLLTALPREAMFFAAGTMIYSLMLGFSYASYTALQFETVGEGAVASKNALLNAFGNVPITYMPILLGIVHDQWSTTAMLLFEVMLTSFVITIFAFLRPRTTCDHMGAISIVTVSAG
ncbi:hypothetical protein GRI58_12485 [Porphyrobacter algicida]|uniref:MFS transporter n=1 Tax=Qipengyuania algicida TaxID=1836209 RepID=A0A845AKF0_9SPHN|nr:MFS transporter [Qipengyuania algicida]MXP29633.1 hypothetical protein [Qipengyuania algicida]